MGRTACTGPQCLYKGALYLYNSSYSYKYFLKKYFQTHARTRAHTHTHSHSHLHNSEHRRCSENELVMVSEMSIGVITVFTKHGNHAKQTQLHDASELFPVAQYVKTKS